ncbi:MAG: aminoacetone oxidase family FAD-binding enzyme [Clostridia bacterium]|nr:aminoacetone oxidase family FAD-binding enzyme [Clostridia bacterium]
MKKYDVIIIGGCASGLAAAINAHRIYPELSVAVIEKLPRVGKKILATGNGRCNLSNEQAEKFVYHIYTNDGFAAKVLKKCSVKNTLVFFSSLGLKTYTDGEGRIYPLSNTAASVLDALRAHLDGIDIITGVAVNEIKKQKSGFVLNGEYRCEKLIMAAGGKASPSQGSDGSGYALAGGLGHTVTKLYPALVPLTADPAVTKPLKGVRIHKAKIGLYKNEELIGSSYGEILFTDGGISGIAAMETASAFEKNKEKGADIYASIDLVPEIDDIGVFLAALCRENKRDFDALLTGLMPKAAGIAVLKACGLYSASKSIDELKKKDIENIVNTIHNFRIKVTGTKGFTNAQVTSGGVSVKEINPATMESRVCENLFFAGEIIDVDGPCGGFNLQWAWSSGLIAGRLGGNGK